MIQSWVPLCSRIDCFDSFSILMAKCFSFTASRDWCYRYTFANAGLRSATTDLGDGTMMHCWVPKTHKQKKPTLLLVHGFGANAMWQWSDLLRPFITRFNIYVPDLLFFGDSFTTRPERTESFQAQCMMKLMEAHGVSKLSLVGISYGGFVAYSMAAQFPEAVERVVLCCAGVCLEEKDLKEGLFVVSSLEEAASVLMPQTPEKLRELVRLSFVKPAKTMPSCFLRDFIDVMCTEYVEEKTQLIQAILKDRKLSDLPKITQPTLIVWGEQDQIFPLELGRRLKSHIGENAKLEVIKNAGHAVNMEKPKEFYKHLKSFLVDSLHPPPPPPQLNGNKVD
ncbi:monoacylglycerol lipase abhd6-A-like [Telopea speciosissima]|uniref:monoacylglycerol lipase abhd6-A-like n=1 Tax=Telopea speciosissima TaxID=54955 RepID=UPI001CC55FE5|nr:monoacylglycerol lipase abhd6-A-like [Telopea speciosissima]